eukprot:scaffold1353_cov363-Pavlova_lutheri.AAC.17
MVCVVFLRTFDPPLPSKERVGMFRGDLSVFQDLLFLLPRCRKAWIRTTHSLRKFNGYRGSSAASHAPLNV